MKVRSIELRDWEGELIEELEQISRQLEPLLSRKEELRAKLELVQRLRSLEEGEAAAAAGERASTRATMGFAPTPVSVGNEIQTEVREILEARGQPMHIRDIRTALTERGVPIPGRGTDANLIVHLRRAPDVFDRRARGTYGLAGWKAASKRKAG